MLSGVKIDRNVIHISSQFPKMVLDVDFNPILTDSLENDQNESVFGLLKSIYQSLLAQK